MLPPLYVDAQFRPRHPPCGGDTARVLPAFIRNPRGFRRGLGGRRPVLRPEWIPRLRTSVPRIPANAAGPIGTLPSAPGFQDLPAILLINWADCANPVLGWETSARTATHIRDTIHTELFSRTLVSHLVARSRRTFLPSDDHRYSYLRATGRERPISRLSEVDLSCFCRYAFSPRRNLVATPRRPESQRVLVSTPFSIALAYGLLASGRFGLLLSRFPQCSPPS